VGCQKSLSEILSYAHPGTTTSTPEGIGEWKAVVVMLGRTGPGFDVVQLFKSSHSPQVIEGDAARFWHVLHAYIREYMTVLQRHCPSGSVGYPGGTSGVSKLRSQLDVNVAAIWHGVFP